MPEGLRPSPPIHRLRFNESVRAPRAYLVIDTETEQHDQDDQVVHKMRLWCARRRRRRDRINDRLRVTDWWGHTAAELASTVELATTGEPSLWVFAHNLSFDLVTSSLPLELMARGWNVTQLAVTGDSPWMRLTKGRRHLTLADSWSWVREPLEKVGAAVGGAKLALPANDGSEAEWLARCQTDVELLDQALAELMGWWERRSLGVWSLTGASTGWNAMRHFRPQDRMVVDPDPLQLTRDRLAVYGGRRETWVIQEPRHGAWVDMDFRHAYPQVAAQLLLPRRREQPFDSIPVDSPWIDGGNKGVLAEVVVQTAIPRWPARWQGQVFYPVGTFRTVLADPEIAEARRLGCLLEVGSGNVHWLGQALQEWARWVIRVDEGTEDDTPAIASLAAHGWGRTVIGKWAQHSFQTEELSCSPTAGWGIQEGLIHGTGRKAAMVDIGGRRWHVRSDQEGENAYPAVLAWVESHVRLRLSRLLELVEPSELVQCDTDGLIVDAWAGARLEQLTAATAPLTVRRKRTIKELGIWGPQHLKVDGRVRFSGLAARAVEVDYNRYVVRGWPKLAWQMGHSLPGEYRQPLQTFRLSGPYTHRWVLADGRTVPVTAGGSPAEPFRPLPWAQDPRSHTAGPLSASQHPLLRPLAG
ncbi:MAG TPA: hypothetical protein VMV23_00310 [Candidatus Nanopelagicaceae bacterium]|nr:hypothetical protein [Candidatus Nanopelagicaceae bacterium]